jgi:hypothetical protein
LRRACFARNIDCDHSLQVEFRYLIPSKVVAVIDGLNVVLLATSCVTVVYTPMMPMWKPEWTLLVQVSEIFYCVHESMSVAVDTIYVTAFLLT